MEDQNEEYLEYRVFIKVVNNPMDSRPVRVPMSGTVRSVFAPDEDVAIETAKEILASDKGYIPRDYDYVEIELVTESHDTMRGNYKMSNKDKYGNGKKSNSKGYV